MSVIVFWELSTPVCDCCGRQMGAEYSEAAAWAAMKREGWGTQSVPAESVRASEQKLFAPSDEPGKVTVDLCALCVREGKRFEDKPKPVFPPGKYTRVSPAEGGGNAELDNRF